MYAEKYMHCQKIIDFTKYIIKLLVIVPFLIMC